MYVWCWYWQKEGQTGEEGVGRNMHRKRRIAYPSMSANVDISFISLQKRHLMPLRAAASHEPPPTLYYHQVGQWCGKRSWCGSCISIKTINGPKPGVRTIFYMYLTLFRRPSFGTNAHRLVVVFTFVQKTCFPKMMVLKIRIW